MMKFWIAIFMTFLFFSCHAEIRQMYDMKEVFQVFDKADSRTLAIFDVDMVLVQPSNPAFQMANMKRYSSICKRIMKEVPAEKQMLLLSLMTLASEPLLVDERTPQLLQTLQQKGISTMALTANLTGQVGNVSNLELWRVEGLRKLGIDFSKSAPSQNALIFHELAAYRGNYSTYLDGILFVNGTCVSKGDAFLAFLKKIDFSPNKVVFIDDREENLKSLEGALKQLDSSIEYHGIHYLGAQTFPSKQVSEKEFEYLWKKLAIQAGMLN